MPPFCFGQHVVVYSLRAKDARNALYGIRLRFEVDSSSYGLLMEYRVTITARIDRKSWIVVATVDVMFF